MFSHGYPTLFTGLCDNYHDQCLCFFFQDQSSASDTLPCVEKDVFCCAQFTEDDGWYRARIVESSTAGDTPKVHVIYVDFGNHETLPVSRLRMLRKEHAELPMMSVLCALEGVTPPNGVRYRLLMYT